MNLVLKITEQATVSTIIDMSGVNSRATLIDVVSFSPNVTTGLFFDAGCSISGIGIRLANMTDGMIIQGDNTTVRLDANQIRNAGTDGCRINNTGTGITLNLFSTTIIESSNLNFNILNANSTISGNGFTGLDKASAMEQSRARLAGKLGGKRPAKPFQQAASQLQHASQRMGYQGNSMRRSPFAQQAANKYRRMNRTGGGNP